MAKWKKVKDADGDWWEATLVFSNRASLVLMVSVENDKWGYTVSTGGGDDLHTQEGYGTAWQAMARAAAQAEFILLKLADEAKKLGYSGAMPKEV